MKTISILNKLFKFADDVSLLVPQCTDCPIDVELENVENWSKSTKLILNAKKTKEIIFYKSKIAKHKFNIEKLGNIERIEETTLLGVILNSVSVFIKLIPARFYSQQTFLVSVDWNIHL